MFGANQKRSLCSGKSRVKSQISVEYLLTIALSLSLLLPALIIAQSSFTDYQDKIAVSQAEQAVQLLADAAENVYALGSPSQVSLDIILPTQTFSTSISNNTIVIVVRTTGGLHDAHATVTPPLQGTIAIRPGTQRLVVSSEGTYVRIV